MGTTNDAMVVFTYQGNEMPSQGIAFSLNSSTNPPTIGLQSFQLRHHHQKSLTEKHLRRRRPHPESSVSVLRDWFFQHFLHPYPSDADKQILARQTGLSESQVSKWFSNRRERVWKSMVDLQRHEQKHLGRIGDSYDSGAGVSLTLTLGLHHHGEGSSTPP